MSPVDHEVVTVSRNIVTSIIFLWKEKKTVTCKTANSNLAPGNPEWQNGTSRRNKMINSNAGKKNQKNV